MSEVWSDECQESFKGHQLVLAPVLAYADFTHPFILEVDTSHSGLGAVIFQEQDGMI